MSSSRVVIVECAASRTALGVFRRAGSGLRFDALAIETFPESAGREDHWLEITRSALLALGKRLKAAGPVVLVLPPHLVLTKYLKVPRVEPAKRGNIIRFEAGQSIPYALDEVVWDSGVTGERDTGLDVMLAAARLEAVGPLCDLAQAAGFAPRLVLPSTLATLAGYRLVRGARPQPELVLNLGARSTTLLLVEANRFLTRTLAFGGDSLTRQAAGKQHSDTVEAGMRSGRSPGVADDARETLATRLAQEITRSLLHFRRQGFLAQPAQMLLTGGGAHLAGLGETLSARLQLPVDRLDALDAVGIDSDAVRNCAAEQALTLTDLIGAAATQLCPDQIVLNLLPPGRRGHESIRRRQPWLLAAAVLVAAALLPPVVHLHNVIAVAQRKSAAIERELMPLREREARNRLNLQQLGVLKQAAAHLQNLYARRAGWLNLFSDLQERLVRVEDAWLDKLQVLPPAAGSPAKLLVTGRLLDRSSPLAKAGPGTINRVKALLASIVDSPYVAAVESERFDSNQPGILKFDFVLVTDPRHPL